METRPAKCTSVRFRRLLESLDSGDDTDINDCLTNNKVMIESH